MLYVALAFLIVGMIARSLGWAQVGAVAGQLSWVLFLVAAGLLAIHLLGGRRPPGR